MPSGQAAAEGSEVLSRQRGQRAMRRGGGVHVEHDVAEAVGAERREALEQDFLLRGGQPAARTPLELVLQRLEALLYP